MSNYELTVVLPGGISPAKKKSSLNKIEKVVENLEGKIEKVEDLGEKDLAYEIKKNKSGFFLSFVLELESQAVKSLSQKLETEEGVIRHLVIRKI